MTPGKLIRFFIPLEVQRAQTDEYFRARILVVSCLAASVLILPFLYIHYITRGVDDPLFVTVSLAILVAVVTPFLYRLTQSVVFAGVFATFLETLVLASFIYFDGGFFSAALVWVPLLPLFTVFFAGRRFGILSAATLFLFLCFLFYAHETNGLTPVSRVGQPINLIYFLSTAVVLLQFVLIALLYLDWQAFMQKKLSQANAAKSEFLSSMSHELRTPLNAIIGFAQLLSHGYAGELDEEKAEYVEHIESSGMYLLELVNEILDLAKIESGKMEINLEPADVRQTLESSLVMFRDKMKKKNIAFTCILDESLNDRILLLDTRKIRQVYFNLLSNALKFTPDSGSIRLEGAIQNGLFRVSVTDSGIGIPKEQIHQIFEIFQQGRQDSHVPISGSGLGLAISREFVTMHQGRIWGESEGNGKGSRFVVEIPTEPPSSP